MAVVECTMNRVQHVAVKRTQRPRHRDPKVEAFVDRFVKPMLAVNPSLTRYIKPEYWHYLEDN